MKLSESQAEVSFTGEDIVELLQATLAKGASFRMRAPGFSMSPFIQNEDILTVAPLSFSPLGLGRVVAFVHPVRPVHTGRKKLIIHRIVKVVRNHHSLKKACNDIYLIKGDNVLEPDGLIPKRNILGTVTKVERNGMNVRFGLGIERFLIAFLSYKKWISFVYLILRFIPAPIRKFIKCRTIMSVPRLCPIFLFGKK